MVGVLFFKKKIQQNVVRMLTKEFQIPSNQPYCFNVFFSFFNLEENQWQVVMKKKHFKLHLKKWKLMKNPNENTCTMKRNRTKKQILRFYEKREKMLR